MSGVKEYNSTVARNVRFLRTERGLSDRELANLTQGLIQKSLIGKIENASNKKRVAAENVKIIANALGLPPDVITESNKEINNELTKIERDLTYLVDFDVSSAVARLDELIYRTAVRSPREFSKSLILRGRLEMLRMNYDLALSYLKMAYNIGSRAQDYETVFQVQHDKLYILLLQGKYEKVIGIASSEIELINDMQQADKQNSSKGVEEPEKKIARLLFFPGTCFARQRDWISAEKHFLQALNIIPKTEENKVYIGSFCQALGDVYMNIKGRFEDCLEMSEKSIRIASELNDVVRGIYALKTIGEAWYKQGEKAKAIEFFEQAYQKSLSLNIRELERQKLTFWISICKEDIESSLDQLSCLEHYEIAPRDIGEMVLEVARLANGKNNHDLAIRLYEKASQNLLK